MIPSYLLSFILFVLVINSLTIFDPKATREDLFRESICTFLAQNLYLTKYFFEKLQSKTFSNARNSFAMKYHISSLRIKMFEIDIGSITN